MQHLPNSTRQKARARGEGEMSAIKPCCALVYNASVWRTLSCSKPAKVERAGKWYCTIHDPERVKAKRAARQSKFDAESAKRQEDWRRLARYDEFIRLLREYESEWTNPVPDLVYQRQCRDRLFAFLADEPKEGRG